MNAGAAQIDQSMCGHPTRSRNAQPVIAVTITNPELRRNAGLYGRSSTIGMPEWKRVKRAGKRVCVGENFRPVILEPEDAIERVLSLEQRAYPRVRALGQVLVRDSHKNLACVPPGTLRARDLNAN